MSGGTRRSCDDAAGGCGRSAEEGAVLRDGSALCEACQEAIAEVEADDAAKLAAAMALVAKHRAARQAARDWKGNPQPPNIVRVHQLADAFHEVGKVDHYMVGIAYPFSDEELEAAEQILIDRQNGGPQKGKVFAALERALDAIESERTKRRQRSQRLGEAEAYSLMFVRSGLDSWEVWTSLPGHDPTRDAFGFIIGTGIDKNAAAADAVRSLEAMVERLQAPAGLIEVRA